MFGFYLPADVKLMKGKKGKESLKHAVPWGLSLFVPLGAGGRHWEQGGDNHWLLPSRGDQPLV